MAFKGVSPFFQIHKDNLIKNKISEKISYPRIAISP